MNQPENRHPVSDKLAFEAMSYVLDEMSPTEKDAFERRLIDDQSAREAVAEAVQICELVTSSLNDASLNHAAALDNAAFVVQPAARVETIWRRPALWTAVVVAASVVLAVFIVGLDRGRSRTGLSRTTVASADMDPGGQLALAWANSATLSETGENDAFTDDEASDTAEESADDGDDAADRDQTEANDWFYEALTLSQRRELPLPIDAAVRGEGRC